MAAEISADALNQIFLDARSHNKWLDTPVPDDLLHRLIDTAKMGPTASNGQPARYLFVKSPEAKARLEPHLSQGNRAKTMSAPVCAIIGYDLQFFEHLPRFFPHRPDAGKSFFGDPERAKTNAFRNGSLQGAYFIIAARALGLDTGPMSGFDNEGVDKEFFPDGRVKSNFLCALGYGDLSAMLPRLPRPAFDEIAQII